MHFCYSQFRSEIALTQRSFSTRNMKALFNIEAPVCHFKIIYWHTSDFLPTVLAHLRHKLCLKEYFRSRPFGHILCVFDRLDAPEAQCNLPVRFGGRRAGTHARTHARTHAHTHTYIYFSLGNNVSRADCTFYVLLANMSRNLATVKTASYNNHRWWFWR